MKFADAFDLNMGKTPDRDNPLFWESGVFPWVAIADIKRDKYISDTKEKLPQVAVDKSKIHLVPRGTVLMSFKLSIGKTAITGCDLYTNEAIMAFEPKQGVDVLPDWLYYYLQRYRWSTNKAVKGQTINKGIISNAYIDIPSRATQEMVADELDRISGIIEDKMQQLVELDRLSQALFIDTFGDPLSNPKRWVMKKIGDIAHTTSGGTPSKAHSEYYEGGTIPWLRSGEVGQGLIYQTELFITQVGLDNSSAKIVPVDTVSIAMYGATVGEVGIIKSPMCTNQAICNIFPNEATAPIFLMYFLKSMKPKFTAVAEGGAQPNISQTVIKNTSIPLPPIALQQSFADKVHFIEEQKALIQESIKEFENLLAQRMEFHFA